MSFDLKISLDDGGAVGTLDKVTGGLEKSEAAAKQATTALQGVGTAASESAGAAASATSRAVAEMERAAQATENYGKSFKDLMADRRSVIDAMNLSKVDFGKLTDRSEFVELDKLFLNGKLNVEQYAAQLQNLVSAASKVTGGGISDELKLQEQIFKRINAPMQQYEASIKALDALLKADRISLTDYNRELERAEAAARKGVGPIQGPARPGTAPAAAGGGYDDSNLVHAAGSGINSANALLAGGVVGMGIQQLGQQIDKYIEQYYEVQDAAVKASNAVQRFTDANHGTNQVISQQMQLADQLHATYTQTIGLYGRLAESADAMGLSASEVTVLTKEFGEAVQIAGKPLDAADGIMRRFSYGMAAGKIEGRELRSIMREMPAIADIWTKSFGATRAQLMQMVKDGRVSTEDLVQALLKGADQVDVMFSKIERTHAQIRATYDENEKILSQKYDVGAGAGHLVDEQVQSMKRLSNETLHTIADTMGPLQGAARAALDQQAEESRAKIADFIEDAKNLTGAFRPLGDAYRAWAGDTAAIRTEVTKINEPIAAARQEIDTLTKAFNLGLIDVDSYTKKWEQLQTTLSHGIGPQALKLTEPIRIARAELARLNNEIEAGANVSQAQYRKAMTAFVTAEQDGVTPEDLKLNNPKLEATEALANLNQQQREGKITAEAYRREYDALITTMNDGRLPAVIKLWESFTLPLRDWREEISAVTTLYEAGRISLLKYTDEQQRLAVSGAKYAQEQFERLQMTAELQARLQAQTRTGFGGTVLVTPDARAEFDKAQVERRRRDDEATLASQPYRLPNSVTSFDAVRASTDMAQYGDATRLANEALERQRALADQFVAPAVAYEDALKDITAAQTEGQLTTEQAIFLQHRARDEYNAATEALQRVKGPQGEYEATLRKLNIQLHDGTISQSKYNDAVDAAKVTLYNATGAAKTFSGAMQIEWIKLQQEAESFGASVAKLVVDDFGKLNDAIVTAANGGEVAWGQMADAMIQDLERLALKMLEIKLIQAGLSLFGSEGAAASAAVGAVAAHATGATWMVGGGSSKDSQLQMFWASPGERVTVSPSGAYPWPTGSNGPAAAPAAAQRAPVVHIHNHYDSTVGLAAVDSRQGNQTVLNVLRANQGAVRSYSGTRR